MTSSKEMSRLLAAERLAAPPPGKVETGLERLLGSLAAHAAPLPVSAGAIKLGGSLLSKWLGIGFIVGLAGAGVAARAFTPAKAISVARPAIGTVSRAGRTQAPSLPPHDGAASASAVRGSLQPSGAIRGTKTTSTLTPINSPTLAEELRLIAEAKRELNAGHPHLARVWLDEHRQRYRAGVLALEREGLDALAGCSEVPRPELARTFAAHYPASPMLSQVQRRCAGNVTRSTEDFSKQ